MTCMREHNMYLTAFMSNGLLLFATLSFHYMAFFFYTASPSGDIFVALHMLDGNCRSCKNSNNDVVF